MSDSLQDNFVEIEVLVSSPDSLYEFTMGVLVAKDSTPEELREAAIAIIKDSFKNLEVIKLGVGVQEAEDNADLL